MILRLYYLQEGIAKAIFARSLDPAFCGPM
jgi:hypothetical protein